jgi:hypothetical protein
MHSCTLEPTGLYSTHCPVLFNVDTQCTVIVYLTIIRKLFTSPRKWNFLTVSGESLKKIILQLEENLVAKTRQEST